MVVGMLVCIFSLGGDQSAGSGDSTPAPPPFEKPASDVLVAKVGSNAVVGYAIDASTGLVAIDGLGNVYVSNLRSNKSKPGYVTIFPPNSNGNVAPVRVLGVPGASLGTTQLRQPIGVAVHARGTLFVTQDDELLVFASSASGNDAPLQRIQHPGLNYATAVSVRDP
jgi:hypothetical protein